MKRSEAKKQKQEQLDKLNIEILAALNRSIDYANELKNADPKPPLFEGIGKMMGIALEIKMLINQRNLIKSQPLPPKKEFQKGGIGEKTEYNLTKLYN